jgi:histidine triad (HIT) family protein
MEETIFHKIVKGEAPCHKIWEDEKHLAFLSIFPNTEGVTVIIPKEFSPSYFVECSDDVIKNLIVAAKKVAKILDASFPNVGRTALVLEGFGVNYLHAKLFPLHGTNIKKWKHITSNIDTYFDSYPGYVCSNDSKREADERLAILADKIRTNIK